MAKTTTISLQLIKINGKIDEKQMEKANKQTNKNLLGFLSELCWICRQFGENWHYFSVDSFNPKHGLSFYLFRSLIVSFKMFCNFSVQIFCRFSVLQMKLFSRQILLFNYLLLVYTSTFFFYINLLFYHLVKFTY